MSRREVSSTFPIMVTAVLMAIFQIMITIPPVFSKALPIPAVESKLNNWIAQNIREFHERKANTGIKALDARLIKAEDSVKIITVRKDGRGDFTIITDAIKSIPTGNTRRVVVSIGAGTYNEKITIDRSKPFVTLYGEDGSMPTITYGGTALKYGTLYSATVAVESDYFVAVNINFVNSAPMPDATTKGAQAVAMRISGDKAAFHNCRFIGFQDTLCDDRGRHFFKDCYIQGTVDFIFGNGKSIYLKTAIKSVAKGIAVITAQARENAQDDSGFTFAYCNITGTGDTYLGRAWKDMPRVVFAYTYMGTLINIQGWTDKMHGSGSKKGVYYGEYKCMGPGASSSRRAKFTKILSDEESQAFLSMTYIQGNKWLLPPPNLSYIRSHFPNN